MSREECVKKWTVNIGQETTSPDTTLAFQLPSASLFKDQAGRLFQSTSQFFKLPIFENGGHAAPAVRPHVRGFRFKGF